MRASELIERLQALIEEGGDRIVEVWVEDYERGGLSMRDIDNVVGWNHFIGLDLY